MADGIRPRQAGSEPCSFPIMWSTFQGVLLLVSLPHFTAKVIGGSEGHGHKGNYTEIEGQV